MRGRNFLSGFLQRLGDLSLGFSLSGRPSIHTCSNSAVSLSPNLAQHFLKATFS